MTTDEALLLAIRGQVGIVSMHSSVARPVEVAHGDHANASIMQTERLVNINLDRVL